MNEKIKREFVLAIVLLLAAAACYAGYRMAGREPAAIAEVSIDGHMTHEFPLNLHTNFVIEGADGGTNHLVIEDGKAYIDEASCPDKICISQGAVSESGQTIVCLPNRVVVTIK